MEFCPKKTSYLVVSSWKCKLKKNQKYKSQYNKTETSKPKVRILGSQMTKEINKENLSLSASRIFLSKVQFFFISKLK